MQDGLSVNDIVNDYAASQKDSNPSGGNLKNDNEGSGNEGGGSPPPDNQNPNPPASNQPDAGGSTDTGLANLLKELNVDSVDALKEKLKGGASSNSTNAETPEEREKRESVYEANLQSYSVENGLMKLDDFQKRSSIKSKADIELVKERWDLERKEDFPDETDEQRDAAFGAEYPLTSQDEKVKSRAERKIKKEASEIRSPLDSSYETAKKDYDNDRELRKNFPEFAKKTESLIDESIPASWGAFKKKELDEDISIDVEINDKDKKEIRSEIIKLVQTPTMYELFKKGEVDRIKQAASDYANDIIRKKYMESALQKTAEAFLSLGKTKGSNVGATVPFPLNDQNSQNKNAAPAGSAEKQVMDSLQGKK